MDRYAMIAVGGAMGALARYQIGALVQARVPAGFPWGTFVVNVSGCFLMGAVMTILSERLVVHPNWRFLVPIGFIGAYTTFSTFEFETFRAISERAFLVGALNVAASVFVGYVALWTGVVIARML